MWGMDGGLCRLLRVERQKTRQNMEDLPTWEHSGCTPSCLHTLKCNPQSGTEHALCRCQRTSEKEWFFKGAKRDGREHVIPDALVFSGPHSGGRTQFQGSSFLLRTMSISHFVRRVETLWVARRVEHLKHVAVFLNVATKLYPRNIRDQIATWW